MERTKREQLWLYPSQRDLLLFMSCLPWNGIPYSVPSELSTVQGVLRRSGLLGLVLFSWWTPCIDGLGQFIEDNRAMKRVRWDADPLSGAYPMRFFAQCEFHGPSGDQRDLLVGVGMLWHN